MTDRHWLSGLGLLTPPVAITSTGTSADNAFEEVDTTSGAIARTLPPTPVHGQRARYKDATASWGTHSFTATGNTGQKLENPNSLGTFTGAGGSVALSTVGMGVTWCWDSVLTAWIAEGATGTIGLAGDGFITVTGGVLNAPSWTAQIPKSIATPSLAQATQTTDAVAQTFAVSAQSAWAGASTHVDGGTLWLEGGRPASPGATGLRGGVQLILGQDTSQVLLEVAEKVINQRIVALCTFAGVTSTNMPANTGNGVAFLADAATLPSANPSGGVILYSDSGVLKTRSPAGVVTPLAVGPAGADLYITRTGADGTITSTTQSTTMLMKSLGGARVANIPAASSCAGLRVSIATDLSLSGTNTVTVTPVSGSIFVAVTGLQATLVLDGSADYPPGCTVDLRSDGTSWRLA